MRRLVPRRPPRRGRSLRAFGSDGRRSPVPRGDRGRRGHRAAVRPPNGRRACRPRRIRVDPSFARYWFGLGEFDRADLIAEAGRHLTLFRDSFPPMTRRWAPQTELTIRARLVDGAVVLTGTPDLQLGRVRRLVIDFKSGRAWPEHPEDMRFYALLPLLRTGVAPYAVATFFFVCGGGRAGAWGA